MLHHFFTFLILILTFNFALGSEDLGESQKLSRPKISGEYEDVSPPSSSPLYSNPLIAWDYIGLSKIPPERMIPLCDLINILWEGSKISEEHRQETQKLNSYLVVHLDYLSPSDQIDLLAELKDEIYLPSSLDGHTTQHPEFFQEELLKSNISAIVGTKPHETLEIFRYAKELIYPYERGQAYFIVDKLNFMGRGLEDLKRAMGIYKILFIPVKRGDWVAELLSLVLRTNDEYMLDIIAMYAIHIFGTTLDIADHIFSSLTPNLIFNALERGNHSIFERLLRNEPRRRFSQFCTQGQKETIVALLLPKISKFWTNYRRFNLLSDIHTDRVFYPQLWNTGIRVYYPEIQDLIWSIQETHDTGDSDSDESNSEENSEIEDSDSQDNETTSAAPVPQTARAAKRERDD